MAHPFFLLRVPPLSPLDHLIASMADSGWGSVDEWHTTDTTMTTSATTANDTSSGPPEIPEPSPEMKLPKTRGYQQEMLDESLNNNIVIALDTGAGKTHIAVLRMRHEVEKETTKVCGSSIHGFLPSGPLLDIGQEHRLSPPNLSFFGLGGICRRLNRLSRLPSIVWRSALTPSKNVWRELTLRYRSAGSSLQQSHYATNNVPSSNRTSMFQSP